MPSVKDIDLKFSQVPTDNSGCCGWAGLVWIVLVVLRARAVANFVLDIVVIRSMVDDPFVVRETFFAFAAFAAAELLLFVVELLVGLKTLWGGKIHAIFFDGVAASISKLSFNRFNVLSRKLKAGCSLSERLVFFVAAQANMHAVLTWLFISMPLTVSLLVLVSFREAKRSEAGLDVDVQEVIDVVLKLILSLIDALIIVVCVGLWPIARFAIAKRPLELWATRRVRRRLHKMYPEIVGKLSGRVPGQPVAPEDDWTESEDMLEAVRSTRVVGDAVETKDIMMRDADRALSQHQAKVDSAVDATKKAVASTETQANQAVVSAVNTTKQSATQAVAKTQEQVDQLIGKVNFPMKF